MIDFHYISPDRVNKITICRRLLSYPIMFMVKTIQYFLSRHPRPRKTFRRYYNIIFRIFIVVGYDLLLLI